MWGVRGLRVHGIWNCRLVYREVVKLGQTTRCLTCGDLEILPAGGRIEKDRSCVPPEFVWGKGEEGVVCLSVCGAPLDDQANDCSVDGVFFRAWFKSRF